MRCGNCKNKVLQKSGTSTRLRAHGPVEFNEGGTCKFRCYYCKSDVELPIQISAGAAIPSERFVLKKGAAT